MTSHFKPGTPSWVDLGSTDIDGAAAFYGAIFGWAAEDLGPDAGDYRIFRLNGQQVGGLGPATDPARGTSWATYFDTADADDTAARVEANGGKVIVPPSDVMGQGRFAVFTDPAGAFFSVWEAGEHKGAEVTTGHGTLSWAELSSTDIEAARAFYGAVLPVSVRTVPAGDGSVGMDYSLLEIGEAAVAGMMATQDGANQWNVYFAVDDVDATADRAVELGATEQFRTDSPPGRMAGLTDPQGGVFYLIRPVENFTM